MATFIPNLAGIQAIASSTAMAALLRTAADHAADIARNIAPVDTGAYQDSISVDTEMSGGEVVARFSATVPYAVFVEFGTEDTPTFAVLRRAAEMAGLRFGGTSRYSRWTSGLTPGQRQF